jgi:hypothetical protein
LLGASVLAEAAGAVGAVLNPNGPLAALSFGSVSVLLLAIAVRELPAVWTVSANRLDGTS